MKHDNLAAGGPAFPVADPFATHQPGHEDEARRLMSGMTLRDYFAAQALPVAFSIFDSAAQGNIKAKHVAILSYQLADAMLRAREGAAS